MKKLAIAFTLFTIVLPLLSVPVEASISISATIDNNIYVVFNLENINATVYDEIKANLGFNISTIPQAILQNLLNQERKSVRWGPGPQTNIFDDGAKAIRVSFYLGGSDIISFTTNRTTLKRTYQLKTDWIKFQLNLAGSFTLNFTRYFAKPVSDWQKIDYTDAQGNKHPSYYYQANDTGFSEAVSFYFILPVTATNVQAEVDTITFEVPPYFEDLFLSSPFLVLAVLLVVVAFVLIYRRAR